MGQKTIAESIGHVVEITRSIEIIEKLQAIIKGKKKILILVHNNPDPDAIGAAVGLQFLLKKKWNLRSVIAYRGIIGRVENRAMVKVLKLGLVPLKSIKWQNFLIKVLVDSQPGLGNCPLKPDAEFEVVIDHHQASKKKLKGTRINDVRINFGSTSTLIAVYLFSIKMQPSPKIATALFYGIITDTNHLSRKASVTDREMYNWLFPLINVDKLNKIEQARQPAVYFTILHNAMEQAKIYKDAVVVDAGEQEIPDYIAELAEFFLKLEGIRWSFVVGSVEKSIFFSIRTTNPRADAGNLAVKVAGRQGTAGGHRQYAGGKLELEQNVSQKRNEMIKKFLKYITRTNNKCETLIPGAAKILADDNG